MSGYRSLSDPKTMALLDHIISFVDLIKESATPNFKTIIEKSSNRLKPLSESVKEAFKSADFAQLQNSCSEFIREAKQIKQIILELDITDPAIVKLATLADLFANDLLEILAYNPQTAQSDTAPPNNNNELRALKEEWESLKADQIIQDAYSKKVIADIENQISSLNLATDAINSRLQEEIDKAKNYHTSVALEIDDKNKQINSILEIASSDVLSGDHGKNAAAEEKTADRLRYSSVACMLIILAVLGFTVWESTKASFSWDAALFRVSIAFLLSVPAAYLARESAKHREQQYYYRQTALNLKAISPYIASLPDAEQHKLKIDIASNIFSGREASKFESDSYPINIQEILITLLSKIESPSTKYDSKSKTTD